MRLSCSSNELPSSGEDSPPSPEVMIGGGIGDGMRFGAAGTLPERRGALNLWTFESWQSFWPFPLTLGWHEDWWREPQGFCGQAFLSVYLIEVAYREVWIGLEVYDRLGRLSDQREMMNPSKMETSWRRMKMRKVT